MHFDKRPKDMIELPYIEKGTLYFSDGRIMPEGTLNLAVFDREIHGVSRGMPHRHCSIGIKGGIYEQTCSNDLLAAIRTEHNSEHVFFAARDTAFFQKTSLKAKDIIEEIIAMQLAERSKSAVLSKLFSLFALISEDTLSSLLHESDTIAHSDYLYCSRARKYISEHIYEKIYIEDIAENLSLSRGHISRIFKSVTSYALIEYINKTKIDAICEILNTLGCTAAELADLFSLSDEKYLCRLFKKYKGMSITEYKRIERKKV